MYENKSILKIMCTRFSGYPKTVWQYTINGAQMWGTGTLLSACPSVRHSVFTIFTLGKKVRCSHDSSIGTCGVCVCVCV